MKKGPRLGARASSGPDKVVRRWVTKKVDVAGAEVLELLPAKSGSHSGHGVLRQGVQLAQLR